MKEDLKKIFIIFLPWLVFSLITIVAVTRCEKSTVRYCWDCEISTTQKIPNNNPYEYTAIYKWEYCDVTEEFIQRFEQGNTWKDSLITQKAICRIK